VLENWRLHAAGALMASVYAVLGLRLFHLPAVDLALLPSPTQVEPLGAALRAAGPGGVAVYVAVVGGLFGLYLVAWRSVRHTAATPGRLAVIIGWAAILGVLNLVMQPAMSSDIFDYAFRGRQYAVHGLNPLVHPPAATPHDPWLRHLFWPELPSPYGPLWLAVEIAGWWLGRGDLVATIAALKLIGLTSYLTALIAVWRILALTAPAQVLAGVVLLGWNPLVVVEWVGNGHNDVLMVALVLLGWWALARGRWLLMSLALTAAVLVKAIAVLAVPLVIIWAVRRWQAGQVRLRTLAAGGALGAALAVGAYAWLWAGPETLLHVVRVNQALGIANSLPYAVIRLSSRFAVVDATYLAPTVRLAGYLLFVVCYALIAARLWRAPATLPRAWFDASFAFLLVGTAWFWPWYVTWLLAAGSLVTDRRRQRAAIAYSVAAALLYGPLLFFGAAEWQVPVAPYLAFATAALVGHGVPAALLLYALWMERRTVEPAPPAAHAWASRPGAFHVSQDEARA
jgi:hypothetical protein